MERKFEAGSGGLEDTVDCETSRAVAAATLRAVGRSDGNLQRQAGWSTGSCSDGESRFILARPPMRDAGAACDRQCTRRGRVSSFSTPSTDTYTFVRARGNGERRSHGPKRVLPAAGRDGWKHVSRRRTAVMRKLDIFDHVPPVRFFERRWPPPGAAWPSSVPTARSSPPMRRSIRRRGRCTSGRRCASSTPSLAPRRAKIYHRNVEQLLKLDATAQARAAA